MDEAEFQRRVIRRARLGGWFTVHVRKAMAQGERWITATDPPGWPDLVLIRERVVFVELKKVGSYLSPAQRVVHDRLAAAGAELYVWRPTDWRSLCEVLGTRPASTDASA